jgi:MFS family permease
MFITGVATILAALLFALHPVHGSYWAWVFPAMICCTLAIDLVFNISTIFLTTSMPARQQGLAGSLANVMTQFSIALFLGLGDIVVTATSQQGQRQSYKNAFWFELACGGVALGLFMGFVRIEKARSDYTADEKEEQEAKAEAAVVAAETSDVLPGQ